MYRGLILGALAFAATVLAERQFVFVKKDIERYDRIRAMSGDARHVPSPGPTPVSVHDDGDMLGKTRPIEPQVNVRFLALHPRRNRVSQAELSESKLTHEIQCVQCDGSFHAQQLASSAPLPEKIGRISLAMWRMTVKADRSSAERGPAAYSPRFGGISSDRA